MRGQEAPDEAGATVRAPVDRRQAMALAGWTTATAVAGTVSAVLRRRAPAPQELRGRRVSATRTVATPRRSAPPAPPSQTATPVLEAAPVPATAAGPVLVGDALALHVARRLTFGPTPDLLDEIAEVGVATWIEQQLAPGSIPDDDATARLAPLVDLDREPRGFRDQHRFGDDVLADLRVGALVRAVHSRRQLHELMVDLWHDHLTASAAKGAVAWHLPHYDRAVIRPHALGRFRDLLIAATTSGAMLEYLDTAASSAPDVNENHGRELLELHTVGRDAGFGPSDVQGAARVLSGWTIDARTLTVVFVADRHHDGPATVLGWSTPGRGGPGAAADLRDLLSHLAAHPATARRVAALLARRFVSDDPPPELVASTADAYLAADTDLAATLRHLLASSAFRSGGAPIARRPFDLLAALLRATDAGLAVPGLAERAVPPLAEATALTPVVEAAGMAVDPLLGPLAEPLLPDRPLASTTTAVLRAASQALFAAPSPAGHAVAGRRWLSGDALLRRWTLGALLARDQLPGITVDPPALAGTPGSAGEAVDALARRCFGDEPSAATRAAALQATGLTDDAAISDESELRSLLAILLAAPEVQER